MFEKLKWTLENLIYSLPARLQRGMEITKWQTWFSLKVFSFLPELFDVLLKEVCGLEDFSLSGENNTMREVRLIP